MSAGPSGCPLSRTAMIPGMLSATSTHWPSELLRALLRHTARDRSMVGSFALHDLPGERRDQIPRPACAESGGLWMSERERIAPAPRRPLEVDLYSQPASRTREIGR